MHKKLILASLGLALLAGAGFASHSWSTYHWARTTSSFTLTVIDSTVAADENWPGHVAGAVADWGQSQKVDFVVLAGDTSSRTRRQCNAPDGQIRVCNLAYGNNGWLGIAGISIDSSGHITRGYTKLNDSYFSPSYAGGFYLQNDWGRSVTCQELGHDLGLDHQDEDFNNQSLFTCMDYQDPPYPFPNQHDYDQLATIYGHTDSYNSYVTDTGGGGGGGGGGGCNAPPGKGCNKGTIGNNGDIGWGMSLGRRGQVETFIRIDPDGTRHLTFVTWAIGH